MKNILHIQGQEYPHDDVSIVGDKGGLLALKNAIEHALNTSNQRIVCQEKVMTNDGEYYSIYIQEVKDAKLETLPVPYWAY